ncbi:putative GPI-anchored protein pfl2 [Drosophila eugracilis]|uniref:putative GPI-anchored protein pfl2 n=1 Tax=Drosophila eugracilis TaxID=29029 RepID=UPI0007E7FE03|nr:putative GPI-anchored protein pfl2 [Drosophila eugracilis]XP_017064653.1 putative GPI-anchored protein pfl2 [Drosophila eugracilis]XP_017064654.1 putative GPI-anchored protein pfl2 [Drosophila eugracilis]
MHIEIQVALNFVISYLYNKLPRRRVNIFGEELEKALRDKFQGHWYPEKPFKGSAYRCLKTGDPIDSVLERAARESGVPIGDILENLPNELSVWVDPGEVSFRIGEKGAVKILYTENNENHEDSHSADREVTKMFNPEAQCFRPIDAVNTTMNNLSLSPKALPLSLPQAGSSPHSAASSSPTYKGSPNPTISGSCSSGSGAGSGSGSGSGSNLGPGPGTVPVSVAGNNATANAAAAAFMQRGGQAPLTFTTATFAQTKFGSTKLKTSSKRTNSSAYRMSPTEFSNYIKQRAMQQQMHHSHGVVPSAGSSVSAAFAGLDAVSPARSLSPNPLSLSGGNPNQSATGTSADPFYYPNMAIGLYPQFGNPRNLFESHFNADASSLGLFVGGSAATAAAAAAVAGGGANKYSAYLDPCYFGNGHANSQHPQQQQQQNRVGMDRPNVSDGSCFGLNVDCGGGVVGLDDSSTSSSSAAAAAAAAVAVAIAGDSSTDNSPLSTPNAVTTTTNVLGTTATATNSSTNSSHQSQPPAAQDPSSSSTGNNNNNNNNNNSNNKLIDGISSFYGTGSSYQQLLVAN